MTQLLPPADALAPLLLNFAFSSCAAATATAAATTVGTVETPILPFIPIVYRLNYFHLLLLLLKLLFIFNTAASFRLLLSLLLQLFALVLCAS